MNTDKEDEATLILGCIQKSRGHQELLYKKYYGYVMAISLSYGSNREDAREIVDDTFMKVFEAIGTFDRAQPFKGWIRRITINTAIDHLRKNKKFKHYLEIGEQGFSVPAAQVVDTLVLDDIHRLISALPDTLKMVFNLYEIEGYSHKEIGNLLGITESSSRTYLTRAKERLRTMVATYFN